MDYLAIYQKYLPNITRDYGDQWRDNCPFHNEKTKKNKSFCVNMETGQFHCHSCGESGNATDIKKHFGESTHAYHNSSRISGFNKTLLNKVDTSHKRLLDNLEYAPQSWNIEYIKLLKVGWNIDKENFVFPIFTENNDIINVKHHHGSQFRGASTTLYPLQLLNKYDNSYIIIAEGEKDTISLLSQGLQAVTSTGGAKTLPNDISQLLRFKKIYICLDNDDPGDAGTDLWIKKIRELNLKSFIRVCDLSSYVDEGGDVTDYFNIDGKSQQTFKEEILVRSMWGKMPGTDVPDYLRKVMLSDEMKKLLIRDQVVLFNLIIRATRYRVKIENLNGMRVPMKPGEYVKSYGKLAKLCGKNMTATMVDDATTKLESLGLIRKENLKRKRGMKFSINNWIDENGHSESHSDLDKTGIQNIKFLSPEELIDKLNNGHSDK